MSLFLMSLVPSSSGQEKREETEDKSGRFLSRDTKSKRKLRNRTILNPDTETVMLWFNQTGSVQGGSNMTGTTCYLFPHK
jgi:hypothetical protein